MSCRSHADDARRCRERNKEKIASLKAEVINLTARVDSLQRINDCLIEKIVSENRSRIDMLPADMNGSKRIMSAWVQIETLFSTDIQRLKSGQVPYIILPNFLSYLDPQDLEKNFNYVREISSRKHWKNLSSILQRDNKRVTIQAQQHQLFWFPSVTTKDDKRMNCPTIFKDIFILVANIFDTHKVADPSILYSFQNSLRQNFHVDFPNGQRNPAYGCLYSISGGSRLWSSINTRTGQRVDELIEFDQNSLLIFSSSLEHAGADYDEENYRYHLYVDTERTIGKRKKAGGDDVREYGKAYPTINLNM